MSDFFRAYGRLLGGGFLVAVAAWAVLLIVSPQLAIVERSITPPKRQLDSAIAGTLAADALTCRSVLQTYRDFDARAAGRESNSGGLAVPSLGGTARPVTPSDNNGLAIPSLGGSARPVAPSNGGGLAIPSLGGGGLAVPSVGTTTGGAAKAKRPYILQCDRATTSVKLVRDDTSESVTLRAVYGLDDIAVRDTDPIDTQMGTAERIAEIAEKLRAELLEVEAGAFPYSLQNYEALVSPILIPMTQATREREASQFWPQVQSLLGLRVERDGQVYVRLGLITLLMTIGYALIATALALIVCYPIAYNLAVSSGPQRAAWLFLALLIPYAIVEIMRVYAWVSILETQGVLNQLFDWMGLINLANDEAIQFKRSPIAVFVVIVYTYILFMVFPLTNVMSTLPREQIEAARDLGASTWRLHTRIVIPHTKPGIAVGCIATFMLAAGAFSVPRIISRGLQSEWFSQTIYNKFFESENSTVGAAYAFAFMFLCFAIVALFMFAMRARIRDFARV